MDDTGTWHYGLVARWWAEVNTLEPLELDFYRTEIEGSGEPALDLGCGTGRLLVPLLAAGLDVDGVDVSADMLRLARSAGERAGLDMERRLARGTFAGFAMPRRYRTIVCCDSFGIGGDRAADQEALRNIHRHLARGGTFVMSIDRAMPELLANLGDPSQPMPRPWPDHRDHAPLVDGDALELLRRTGAFDPVARVERMDMRARLWRDDRLIAEEEGTLWWTHYEIDELVAMLRVAGFEDIDIEGRYTCRPPAPGDETIVLRAHARVTGDKRPSDRPEDTIHR